MSSWQSFCDITDIFMTLFGNKKGAVFFPWEYLSKYYFFLKKQES